MREYDSEIIRELLNMEDKHKEKASDLYWTFLNRFQSPLFYTNEAKWIVKFMCDEFIKEANGTYESEQTISYWTKVKEEVDKI